MNRTILESAVNQYATANSAMCSAIEENVKVLSDNGKKAVLFSSEIDCATCEPLVSLQMDGTDVVAVDEQWDYISLDDLSGNELFEICNHLMAGNYQIADAEE